MELVRFLHLICKHTQIKLIEMKKLLALAFVAILSLNSFAQTADLRKKIHVSGSAETEVTPDIIYIGISLKEYFSTNPRLVFGKKRECGIFCSFCLKKNC